MRIRELFRSDVTRDIPPVVYFHEQSPPKLAAEVSEYIITGGWPEEHPNHRRVPNGIHEQYVALLGGIATELAKRGGPELPNAWISGFYGSGKSSFAKIFGLSLDGVALPDGMSLAEAWLRRDTSPKAGKLREAWQKLREKIEPIAVVFDIGSEARDNEHLHSAAIRQVQKRLGYCSTEPLVADFELKLERDGEWTRFEGAAREVLGMPWADVKDRALAEDKFSQVMSRMFPDTYSDPMAWFSSRVGTHSRSESPEEAVKAIGDMLKFRKPDATLFLVVDEVSQYVLSSEDRVERLRAFAEQLGARLKGKVWLLALGQQKLEEAADDSFLVKTKDRFPPKLRVHLAATNIRDVVHRRLLQKKSEHEALLRRLFDEHRPDLSLYAYGCDGIRADDFVDVYPMLPGQIDLILQITTELRGRSSRAQGDDQAIRGLLQLLGELFRDQDMAEKPVGTLVTLDQVYDVQHTALDSEVQNSMARVLAQCADDASGLLVRAAKAVALLELIQENVATDAKLVAQCLYDRVDRGNNVAAVTAALEELRRRNLLGYSEKQGYKIQSTASEEWERERRDIGVGREPITEVVQESLKYLLATPERPKLGSRAFQWAGVFSDGRRTDNATLVDPRNEAVVRVDFRFLTRDERAESAWIVRSNEAALHNRLVWVVGDNEAVDELARELSRSRVMVRKYKARRESLNAARKLLLQQEENRVEDLEKKIHEEVASAWMTGRLYFRSGMYRPADFGGAFATALQAVATRILPDLFTHFIDIQVQPSEVQQLLEPELTGPSPKFLPDGLGILELDAGRYRPACTGIVPTRVRDFIAQEQGVSGAALLAHFGGPPYGYTDDVVKACVAGLLRNSQLRVQPESGNEMTAVRDAGVRDLFEKDRSFRKANFFPGGQDDIGVQARARICAFFQEAIGQSLDREDHVIADAVSQHFPALAQRLRSVQARLNQLPGSPEGPDVLGRVGDAMEECLRTCRQTSQTVRLVKRHLDTLRDGIHLVQVFDVELTSSAIEAVRAADDVLRFQAAQLDALGVEATNVAASVHRARTQLQAERPWQEIGALEQDLDEVRRAYVAERRHLLERQEQQVEQARSRVKTRAGFSTLTAEQSHGVLRPLARAISETGPDAVAPPLIELRDMFEARLHRAEEQANDTLDEILSQGDQPLVARVDLQLHNRELTSAQDVDALVGEIRDRLMEPIRAGARVRLV